MALAGLDTANLASYSDESTNEPALTGLRDRVQVELVRACGALTQAEVVIETVDGSILRRRHDCGVPATDLDAQGARLKNKFRAIAHPLLDPESSDEVLHLIDRLEDLPDLSPLAGLLACQPVRVPRH
jgi:hypothetical protein